MMRRSGVYFSVILAILLIGCSSNSATASTDKWKHVWGSSNACERILPVLNDRCRFEENSNARCLGDAGDSYGYPHWELASQELIHKILAKSSLANCKDRETRFGKECKSTLDGIAHEEKDNFSQFTGEVGRFDVNNDGREDIVLRVLRTNPVARGDYSSFILNDDYTLNHQAESTLAGDYFSLDGKYMKILSSRDSGKIWVGRLPSNGLGVEVTLCKYEPKE